jgi:hypothetical protein
MSKNVIIGVVIGWLLTLVLDEMAYRFVKPSLPGGSPQPPALTGMSQYVSGRSNN